MENSQTELSAIKQHLLHHRIIIYGMLGLLVILTYGLIVSIKELSKSPQSVSKANASIAPQTSYQNPFDKDSQYINPFSHYKNPFDNLK